MIVERELMMSENDLKNTDWFPNYIMLRRPADHEGFGEGAQWQGFIKEIKAALTRHSLEHNKEIVASKDSIKEVMSSM